MLAKQTHLWVLGAILIYTIAAATAQTIAKPMGLDKADQMAAAESAQSNNPLFGS